MTVKNKLKEIRYDMKMEKGEFAEYLGINNSQYSRYENNRVQPNLETALMISQKVNKTVNEIFEWIPS